jgi:hypothetical protein
MIIYHASSQIDDILFLFLISMNFIKKVQTQHHSETTLPTLCEELQNVHSIMCSKVGQKTPEHIITKNTLGKKIHLAKINNVLSLELSLAL